MTCKLVYSIRVTWSEVGFELKTTCGGVQTQDFECPNLRSNPLYHTPPSPFPKYCSIVRFCSSCFFLDDCCSLLLIGWSPGVTVPVPLPKHVGVAAILSLLRVRSFRDSWLWSCFSRYILLCLPCLFVLCHNACTSGGWWGIMFLFRTPDLDECVYLGVFVDEVNELFLVPALFVVCSLRVDWLIYFSSDSRPVDCKSFSPLI